MQRERTKTFFCLWAFFFSLSLFWAQGSTAQRISTGTTPSGGGGNHVCTWPVSGAV